MLVLSRKKYETIHIDGPCVITVCDIKGSSTRLGIEAARDVAINRGEHRDDTRQSRPKTDRTERD
jgi:carbon storage regulator CsrA